MKVKLQEQLTNYMSDHHHNVISLKLIHDSYSGYDIHSQHPSIRYHEPKHMEKYNVFSIDDVTVYIEKNIKAYDDQLEFVDESLFGVHRCHVKGIDLDYAGDFMKH